MIVEKESAVMGMIPLLLHLSKLGILLISYYANTFTGLPREHTQYLQADHRRLVKFESTDDPNYNILLRCFNTTIEDIERSCKLELPYRLASCPNNRQLPRRDSTAIVLR